MDSLPFAIGPIGIGFERIQGFVDGIEGVPRTKLVEYGVSKKVRDTLLVSGQCVDAHGNPCFGLLEKSVVWMRAWVNHGSS